MSRFPQLAFVLSLTACESLVPPESAPTTPRPIAKPEPAPAPEQIPLMTRAGPKWTKQPAPPRVRVVQEPK